MGTKEKLRERFLKLPSDFTFDDIKNALEEKVEASVAM